MSTVVSLDWGGTWLRAGLVRDGRLHGEPIRAPVPATVPSQLDLVDELVSRVAAQAAAPVDGVGVAVAGIVQGGRVASSCNLGIGGMHLSSKLETLLGRRVLVINDGQAAALAEAAALPPEATVVTLLVGTGIGGAITQGRRLVLGRGAAGDFGHTPVLFGGPLCPCGRHGCLEGLAAGRALDIAAQGLALSGSSPALARLARERRVHAADLAEAAAREDPAALEAVRHAAAALVAGLRAIAAACDPDYVVLGGGALPPGSLFRRLVEEGWQLERSAWTDFQLVAPRWSDQAALLGVAGLFEAPAAGTGR